ncbi:MAG: hypothetical protein ACUVRL_08880 [Candidatus Saccharicenans sp.]|uniref:hypothetical protein n=1 Tax=Candidatus Saccharicenans sp. TaxID=2819258 RepID=UPI0040499ECE
MISGKRQVSKQSTGMRNLFLNVILTISFLLSIVPATFCSQALADEKITSPESFFGFHLGADRKIARWDKIVDYFSLLEKESPRIKVVNMGLTTMGQPFLLVIISSPDNLASLEKIKQINQKISDPRLVPATEVPELISQGKAIIC